jgi:hypothetical protein
VQESLSFLYLLIVYPSGSVKQLKWNIFEKNLEC